MNLRNIKTIYKNQKIKIYNNNIKTNSKTFYLHKKKNILKN